eukprot:TRINITY_DN60191_c0_g1_i1.p1 TRINITY_DN60191_c0_g1~~TRINITY_DN60191_c0_g1_i1.p1  ORF type:complete len:120 (-),score=2.88 TRINITY_DN60191_c0_g1_i1:87-419(-)
MTINKCKQFTTKTHPTQFQIPNLHQSEFDYNIVEATFTIIAPQNAIQKQIQITLNVSCQQCSLIKIQVKQIPNHRRTNSKDFTQVYHKSELFYCCIFIQNFASFHQLKIQ